jgi:hypothetical protein
MCKRRLWSAILDCGDLAPLWFSNRICIGGDVSIAMPFEILSDDESSHSKKKGPLG